ncbi:hypothetical protein GSU68_18820 (plasmid) [Rathayibacter sp. VKM Ac-2759]|uniref:F510_1955 family glycosylhydrolase n=1 Tax=Rathayibacter sp. VKM Ac-2759 TaxID=2609252 RepID=UPI001318C9BA|nr:hypothetical protein [Rathayibacter sp. VKM Ac-2759]QHC68757.1 hypothetical protein GSU68_18820 [Rathayibacter sp. VKM Ac-2759]
MAEHTPPLTGGAPAGRSRHPSHVAGVLAAAAALAALTGCTASAVTDRPAAPEGLEHVHGLGWDPVTGLTYAAAHSGVWVIDTDILGDTYPAASTAAPSADGPIADRAQDTMGFTITSDGVFYASGHPDPADAAAAGPSLGLISSTDAARTWESLSLSGETDFHDLATISLDDARTRVYGYDAGTGIIRRSDDSGATWTDTAALALRDLTVDPQRPDRVLASTDAGLQVSDDAGASFRVVDGAPALYLVEGTPDGALVGVDVEGTLWTGALEGGWDSHGTLTGIPEAFAVVGGEESWILAADERGIVASSDYGASWTVLRASS